MAARVPRQLAFALPHAESLTRDNFLEGPANAAGLALVDSWPEWPNRIMLLVGPEGSGKSHLAAIWAEQAGLEAVYLLTTTAAGYFPKLGFVPVERAAVPEEIRASGEFSSVCPSSAVVMHRALSRSTAGPPGR